MPFLMSAEAFADRAFRAIAAGDSYRVIPWQMGVVAKLLRLLPNALFDRACQARSQTTPQSRDRPPMTKGAGARHRRPGNAAPWARHRNCG